MSNLSFNPKSPEMVCLWEWASEVSGLQVIWDMPNAPKPQTCGKEYLSLGLVTGPIKYAPHDERRQVGPEQIDVVGIRRFTLNVTVYGEDALDIGAALQDSLDLSKWTDKFRAKGIAFHGDQGVVDLSAQLETGFEVRAGLDILLSYAVNRTDEMIFVEQVELANLIDGTETVIEAP